MPFDVEKRVKLIKEELAFIGRYLCSISPKLSRYKELEQQKEVLRRELKEIHKKYPETKADRQYGLTNSLDDENRT